MGNFTSIFTTIFESMFPANNPGRILMIGLDAAGKTTILYKLKLNEMITTIPTIGFNVEEIQTKHLTMTVWDIGGQTKIRPLWRHYFQNSNGILYVVDSNDSERIEEASQELNDVLSSPELDGVPLVVICNKQDLPNAVPASEIVTRMKLDKLRNRAWYVQGACAPTGEGLHEAIAQLADLIKQRRKSQQ